MFSKKAPEHRFSIANIFSHDTSPEDIAALHATLEGGEDGIQTFGTSGTIVSGQDGNPDLGEGEERAMGGMTDSQRLKAQIKARKEAKKVEEKKAAKEKVKKKTPAKQMKGNNRTFEKPKRKRGPNKTKKTKVALSKEKVDSEDDDEIEIEEPKLKHKSPSKGEKAVNFSGIMGASKSDTEDEETYRPAEPKVKRGQQASKGEKAAAALAGTRVHNDKSLTEELAEITTKQRSSAPQRKRASSKASGLRTIKTTPESTSQRKRASKISKKVDSGKNAASKRRLDSKSHSISKPSTKNKKKPIRATPNLTEQKNMQDHFKKAMESPWKDVGEGSSSMGIQGRIPATSAVGIQASSEEEDDDDSSDGERGPKKRRTIKGGSKNNHRYPGVPAGAQSIMRGGGTMDNEAVEDVFTSAGFFV